MKFFATVAAALLLTSSTIAHPQPITDIQIISREAAESRSEAFDIQDLWKRKGGGGSGGKGGSSSGSSSSGGKTGYVGSSSSGYSSSSRYSSSNGYSSLSRYSGASRPGHVDYTPPSTYGGSGSGKPSSSNSWTSDGYGDLVSTAPSVYSGWGSGYRSSGSRSGSSCVCSSPEHSGCARLDVDITSSPGPQRHLNPRFGLIAPYFSGHPGNSADKDSSSSSSSSTAGRGSTTSNAGGQTKTGSGVTPNYGGGRYYGGGATRPYTAGGISPLGIVAVPLIVGAGALALYPHYGLYPYGAYAYPYSHPYSFRNRTATNTTNSTNTRRDRFYEIINLRQTTDGTGENETKPVTCLCAMYAVCGCDDNGNTTFLDTIIGDGTYSALNQTLVDVADINGTSTIVLNGTLPNGTTASGGTEDAYSAAIKLGQLHGYWVMVAIVAATCYMI